jgi:hypothetical protein
MIKGVTMVREKKLSTLNRSASSMGTKGRERFDFLLRIANRKNMEKWHEAGTWECRAVFMWIAILGPWKLLPVLAALQTAKKLYGILAPQDDQIGA